MEWQLLYIQFMTVLLQSYKSRQAPTLTYIATHWVLSLNFFCKDQISLFIARTLEHWIWCSRWYEDLAEDLGFTPLRIKHFALPFATSKFYTYRQVKEGGVAHLGLWFVPLDSSTKIRTCKISQWANLDKYRCVWQETREADSSTDEWS
jgi:hypothetical protein